MKNLKEFWQIDEKTSLNKFVFKSNDISFEAFYYGEDRDNPIFILDYSYSEEFINPILVIERKNSDDKWDKILAEKYDINPMDIRPKSDNKYLKLDIIYGGLHLYRDYIEMPDNRILQKIIHNKLSLLLEICYEREDFYYLDLKRAKSTLVSSNKTLEINEDHFEKTTNILNELKKSPNLPGIDEKERKNLQKLEVLDEKIKTTRRRIKRAEKRKEDNDEDLKQVKDQIEKIKKRLRNIDVKDVMISMETIKEEQKTTTINTNVSAKKSPPVFTTPKKIVEVETKIKEEKPVIISEKITTTTTTITSDIPNENNSELLEITHVEPLEITHEEPKEITLISDEKADKELLAIRKKEHFTTKKHSNLLKNSILLLLLVIMIVVIFLLINKNINKINAQNSASRITIQFNNQKYNTDKVAEKNSNKAYVGKDIILASNDNDQDNETQNVSIQNGTLTATNTSADDTNTTAADAQQTAAAPTTIRKIEGEPQLAPTATGEKVAKPTLTTKPELEILPLKTAPQNTNLEIKAVNLQQNGNTQNSPLAGLVESQNTTEEAPTLTATQPFPIEPDAAATQNSTAKSTISKEDVLREQCYAGGQTSCDQLNKQILDAGREQFKKDIGFDTQRYIRLLNLVRFSYEKRDPDALAAYSKDIYKMNDSWETFQKQFIGYYYDQQGKLRNDILYNDKTTELYLYDKDLVNSYIRTLQNIYNEITEDVNNEYKDLISADIRKDMKAQTLSPYRFQSPSEKIDLIKESLNNLIKNYNAKKK